MLRSRDTLDTDAMCGVTYEWLNSQKTRDDAIKGWEQIVGGRIEVLEISGNHFQAFAEPNASFPFSSLFLSPSAHHPRRRNCILFREKLTVWI